MDLVSAREFSFHNDPKNPTKLLWKMATATQWDAYQRANQSIFANLAFKDKADRKASREQMTKGAQIALEFALGRIVGVKAFEVDNGSGLSKELVWPSDKDLILSFLTKTEEYIGAMDLYVRTVMQAHQPQDAEALRKSRAVEDSDVDEEELLQGN